MLKNTLNTSFPSRTGNTFYYPLGNKKKTSRSRLHYLFFFLLFLFFFLCTDYIISNDNGEIIRFLIPVKKRTNEENAFYADGFYLCAF